MLRQLQDWLAPRPAAGPMPEGPLAVIGDVHGCRGLLERLLTRLDADPDLGRDGMIVQVGDIVDRGPDSSGVIDLLASLQAERPDRLEVLRGNHEAMMLDFLDGAPEGMMWLRNGGFEALASLGVGMDANDWANPGTARIEALRAQGRECLGAARLRWLRDRPFCFVSGDVVVVHAAFDATQLPAAQDPAQMIWGRPDFYRKPHAAPPWIVHGHVVTRPAAVMGGRIAVDSGAYLSGVLSAVLLCPGAAPRFITVEGSPG